MAGVVFFAAIARKESVVRNRRRWSRLESLLRGRSYPGEEPPVSGHGVGAPGGLGAEDTVVRDTEDGPERWKMNSRWSWEPPPPAVRDDSPGDAQAPAKFSD
jgi:hypothetical protein